MGSFEMNGNVLKLYCGNGCTALSLLSHWTVYSIWINFMTGKLYLNKADKKSTKHSLQDQNYISVNEKTFHTLE